VTRNQNAFLAVLRACEGTQGDEAWRALFGWRPGNGRVFDSFADHPRQFFDYTDQHGKTYRTSAAGAFQITATTWDDFLRNNGPHDFSPGSQTACALWLVGLCGAVGDLEAGRLDQAISKCGGRWASLPSATVAQPHRSFEFCRSVFVEAGGTLADDTQPAAPIDDRSTEANAATREAVTVGGADNSNSVTQGGRVPFLPIMLSLLPSVLNLFAPRAQAALQKVTQQPPDVVQGFVQSLFDKLGQLTGQTDPIQATAAITKDPAADKVADLQEHALDYLDKLAPVLDKIASYDQQAWTAEETSRDSAASRALKQQEAGPLWSNPTFIIALVVMVLVTVVVAAVLFKGGFSTDMQAFVIGAIVGSALTAVLGFYFGSSRSSSAKDVLIGEMARQAKG
jgi:muramidase (phage lysozyme)